MSTLAADYESSNLGPVTSMTNMHNRTLEILELLHVQLIRPTEKLAGFSFGDSPFVNHNRQTDLVGPIDGLALGDSDLLLMPLTRYCAVAFTKDDEGDVEVPPSVVDSINKLVWRSAQRFVASHPGDHPAGVVPDYRAWLDAPEREGQDN